MPSGPTDSIAAPPAVEFCRAIPIDRAARKLLRDDLNAAEFVSVLADAQLFQDAACVLAFLLPLRESIWWACQCARQIESSRDGTEGARALEAAETWVAEMTEEARRAAELAAREATMSTAGGCVGFAAFYSGGSMAPADAEPVPPPPEITPQFVAASILISALSPNPAEAPARFRLFLTQGLELYRSSLSSS